MVSFKMTHIFHLAIVLLISCSFVNVFGSKQSLVAPTKIGDGYRLVSLQESSDGGLVGLLKVNQKNNIYGPDIPHLQLYIK